MLALVDCNSCFASCEVIFRPELRDQAVVIASNNDGCIVARSSKAKTLNIPDLAPLFKVRTILEQHHVHIFSSNYELYGDISSRIMSLLSTFCVDMEVYSIDEAFLDLEGFTSLVRRGHEIKKAIWIQQRMPVCVGIAQTKTLAKLANHLAKKSIKLQGVCVLDELASWEAVFKKIPTSKVWGVGARLSKRLALLGVFTVQDLRTQPPKRIRKEFGVTLERTVRELNGERCFDLETQPTPKKEIFSSRSFGKKVRCIEELKQSVAAHAVRATEKLRKQQSLTNRIYVMIQTSRFNERPYSNSASLVLPYPTNDTRIIIQFAHQACEHLFRAGYVYAKAGVGLLDLSNSHYKQHDFFEPGQTDQAFKLMNLIDATNLRYGKGKMFLAAQGTQQKWAMARNFKSPSYTTRFSDLPVIKI
jgi:DNA polymerase V